MQWEVVIGLETHVQLSTRSKIFSGAARHFGDEPNVNACYVDLALPGSCRCSTTAPLRRHPLRPRHRRHGRESFRFRPQELLLPDLPKGYQISQFELPVVLGGKLTFPVQQEGGVRTSRPST